MYVLKWKNRESLFTFMVQFVSNFSNSPKVVKFSYKFSYQFDDFFRPFLIYNFPYKTCWETRYIYLIKEQFSSLLPFQIHSFDGDLSIEFLVESYANNARWSLANFDKILQEFPRISGIDN